MGNRLLRVFSAVVDHTESVFRKLQLSGDLCDSKLDFSQKRRVLFLKAEYVRYMPLGCNYDMYRHLRIDIMKGNTALVFIYFFRRNFTAYNFTEDTVIHSDHASFIPNPIKTKILLLWKAFRLFSPAVFLQPAPYPACLRLRLRRLPPLSLRYFRNVFPLRQQAS